MNISLSYGFNEKVLYLCFWRLNSVTKPLMSIAGEERKKSLAELRTKLSIKKKNKCFGADEVKPCMAANTLKILMPALCQER